MGVRESGRPTARRLIALLLTVLALVAVGCTLDQYPQSTLHPRSEVAGWIQDLLESLVFWVVVIFVIVQALLIYTVVRYRSRPGAPEPKPIHGHTGLEVAWTIAPAIILALVAVPTVLAIFKTQGAAPTGAMQVKAIGHQWWWEFQYPELGISTGSEMHVPVGRPIEVLIQSNDVVHSFWIPAMGGKRDAIPTHTNRIWFTPEATGTFPGQCAELCGIQHANMKMNLKVSTPEEFNEWAAHQKSPPVEPDSTTLAARGREIFRTSACVACHAIQDVSAGVIGPNLTHFASRGSIAGAMYPNDPDHLGRWLRNPQALKPGTLMLNLGLKDDQVNALVAYLESLR